MGNVNTVIFDLGGVLVKDSIYESCVRQFGTEKADRIQSALRDEGRWQELDKGTIELPQALQTFYAADPEICTEILYAVRNMGSCIKKCVYTDAWIDQLHRHGLRVLYLSNWAEFLARDAGKALNFIPKMDGGLFSYETGHIKPEAEIYQMLVRKYHLHPEECVFVDDRQANVDAAEGLGMHGILFRNYFGTNRKVLEQVRKGADE